MAVLEVNDLKKGFISPDGEKTPIVDVPRFAVAEAEQIALQGSSGSGKTTFLNLIAGILQPDSGSIRVAGQELSRLSESGRDRVRAQSIGYVFQTFNLLQGYTAVENVLLGMMFGRGVDAEYARSLLERVGLEDRMDYRPRQLSVGQQQRVAVARALANHPQLVLADEPTGNLDFHHATEALKLVREVCREQNAALLLVTHDRDILAQFEHVQHLADINKAVQPQISQMTQI
jgi:putative ABC transport system ATP-binding protein